MGVCWDRVGRTTLHLDVENHRAVSKLTWSYSLHALHPLSICIHSASPFITYFDHSPLSATHKNPDESSRPLQTPCEWLSKKAYV